MAHRLPPRSPRTFQTSKEGWHGSLLASQAQERYQAAERLWSLAEEHRRRAVALEAEARAEEALGDHLAHQAVWRQEAIRPEHRVPLWVVQAAQAQTQAEEAQAARILRQAEEAVEAEDRRRAAAEVEARCRVEERRLQETRQHKQVRFQWGTEL